MIEARRRHRQLRAKQRSAVTLRRGPERLLAIVADCVGRAPVGSALKKTLITVAQVFALIAINQLAFRIAFILTLPGPAAVTGSIMLLGFLSNRIAATRWTDECLAHLRRCRPPVAILIALGIAWVGGLFVTRELATMLTLLASGAAGIAIAARMRPLIVRVSPRPTRACTGPPSANAGLTFT